MGMSLLHFHFLKDSFDGYNTRLTLSMPSHCLLASTVYNEKLAVNRIGILLYVLSGFYFAAFKIFLLSFIIFTMMCLDIDHFAFILLRISRSF